MQHNKELFTPKNQSEELVVTGDLIAGSNNELIRTSPLGSCIAVIAFDKSLKNGAIAHIMLPGKAPKSGKSEENKYAENAITNVLLELNLLGTKKTSIEVCLIGGANVLRNESDTITDRLISNVLEILEKKKLVIRKTSLGGYQRRTAELNLYSGNVAFTIGDKSKKIFYSFITDDT